MVDKKFNKTVDITLKMAVTEKNMKTHIIVEMMNHDVIRILSRQIVLPCSQSY